MKFVMSSGITKNEVVNRMSIEPFPPVGQSVSSLVFYPSLFSLLSRSAPLLSPRGLSQLSSTEWGQEFEGWREHSRSQLMPPLSYFLSIRQHSPQTIDHASPSVHSTSFCQAAQASSALFLYLFIVSRSPSQPGLMLRVSDPRHVTLPRKRETIKCKTSPRKKAGSGDP